MAASYDDETLTEKGEDQAKYMHALTCVGTLGVSTRVYNDCRAKAGWGKETGLVWSWGLAFPNKM